MDHLQALVNGLSAEWQRERAGTQMTLGQLIETLESMPDGTVVEGLGELDSYRGYYCDLAFEPLPSKKPASEILDVCREAMGKVFTGYKGGDYVMGALTPVWVANYGDTGMRLMGIDADGKLELATDEDN